MSNRGKMKAGIQGPRDADQAVREIGIDAPVACGIGVGQRVARDVTADAKVIELAGLSTQAGFDVAQALAIRELCECHTQVLIQTREALDLVLALIPSNAAAKRSEWQMLHHLRKNELALMHRATPRQPLPQSPPGRNRCSNS